MAWVTWVTWGFVAIAAGVVVIAALISRGVIDAGFEPPYEHGVDAAQEPPGTAADLEGDRSDIEWSASAAWRPHLDEGAATHPQPHPRTTGEPADGRHEAQDR